jgi:hypothetical protein
MSDSDKPEPETARAGQSGDAEPVDAEFEPAPDASDSRARKPKTSGGGGIKLFVFVVLAAAIGGGSGYALSRYLPAVSGSAVTGPGSQTGGQTVALEARIAALEAQDAPDLSGLMERVSRLESVTQARDGLSSRVDTLAASLNRLEREIASAASAAVDRADRADGAQSDGQADGQAISDAALAELEARINDAFTQVQSRLDALAGDIETARSEADAARSAAQQANAALAGLSTGEGQDAAPSDQRLAALSGRIDALAAQVGDLPDRAAASAASQQSSAQLAAAQQAIEALQARLGTLADDIAGLSGRVAALESAPQQDAGAQSAGEPVDLAARALAFAVLSEAASGPQAFAVEVEALARVWPGAPGLEALRSVARDGAPTPDRLEETFPAQALREATGEQRTYFGVLRVARQENEGPAAALEQALASDDLAEAARLVTLLDPPGLAAVDGWRAGLSARLQVRQALNEQSAALAAAGGRP